MRVADPGMGKSTLLRMEAGTTAQGEREKLLEPLPKHRFQFKRKGAVETASTQTKPACAGFGSTELSLVRAGGLPSGKPLSRLGLYSRDFQSPGIFSKVGCSLKVCGY